MNNEPIPLLDDLPLSEASLFDFGTYASLMVRIISTSENRTPFVLAIDGAWGSGKTSLMTTVADRLSPPIWTEDGDQIHFETNGNRVFLDPSITDAQPYISMISQEILAKCASSSGPDIASLDRNSLEELKRFRPVRTLTFNAWRYKDESQVLPALLRELIRAIDQDGWLTKAEVLLTRMSSANWVEFLRALTQFLPYLGTVGKALDSKKPLYELTLFDQFRPQFAALLGMWVSIPDPSQPHIPNLVERLVRLDNGAEIFSELRRLWDKPRKTNEDWESQLQPGALALFIDDLDRCPEEHVRDVMKALNLLVDLPGCVYVLGADMSRISRLVGRTEKLEKRESEQYGREFLRKIVQVAFRLPEPQTVEIERFLTTVLERVSKNGDKYSLKRYLKFLAAGLPPNPREIKRFINQAILQVELYSTFADSPGNPFEESKRETLFPQFLRFLLLQAALEGQMLAHRAELIEKIQKSLFSALEKNNREAGSVLVELVRSDVASSSDTAGILKEIDSDRTRYERVARILGPENQPASPDEYLSLRLMSLFARFAAPISGLISPADRFAFAPEAFAEPGPVRIVDRDWYIDALQALFDEKIVTFRETCEGKLWNSECYVGVKNWTQNITAEKAASLATTTQNVLEHFIKGQPTPSYPLQAINLALVARDQALVTSGGSLPEESSAKKTNRLGEFAPNWSDPFNIYFWEAESNLIRTQLSEVEKEKGHGLKGEVVLRGGRGAPFEISLSDFGEEWLLIPAGSFLAGAANNTHEQPIRVEKVKDPFLIGRDPVTVAEYMVFVGGGYRLSDPWWGIFDQEVLRETIGLRRFPLAWSKQTADKKLLNSSPVMGVSLFEALAYSNWLTINKTGLTTPGQCWIATEQQWEKAARGILGRIRPWGNKSLGVPFSTMNPDEPSSFTPESYKDNISPFGARKMAGSFSEWTSSVWASNHFGSSIERDYCKTLEPTTPVAERGGHSEMEDAFRCARRGFAQAMDGYFTRGFRCVWCFD